MSKHQESVISDSQNLSISCNDIPDALLDKTVAKKYFQQFGKVLRIRLRPKHKMCIVEFANEETAQTAYAESGEFEGQEFIVSWTKIKSNNDKRKVRKKLVDPNWSDDLDIKSELEAMKGNFAVNKSFNLRPEAMITEQSQNIPKKSLAVHKTSKSRQWKVEKPIKPKNLETMTDQENELLKTIMTSATTNEEKFRILDARDKLIRSRTVRQSELARATRTIGTCPDMCPEKERLMREVQHQVAAYEQLAGSSQKNIMNHALAVKQYSRSSADQESPLAHELRPVGVLQLTMGYLLHRIMDLCETSDVNLAEWYHFVWDRTRGIRKDVTQQELCCEQSVQLVEQCARFHVHCAARLVAEDISVFDDKINTENLTKCLQTLKYMYHDLKVKHGISCRNEAEFRAYIVLLNLNDGNFMWEVQQLSPDIQRSNEIRFALNVYSALDKNNYVRFFKLIKSTTYLNACILLRYFNQLRYRALLTILKSYSPRLPYPVLDLCEMLAFEDQLSTITFLEYHGLQLNVEKTHVLLDRNKFRQPDTPFALDRAIVVVESKRNTTVGEIVCGEKLPAKLFQTHVPHDSFDERGYLKISELPKDDFRNKYQQFLKQFPHEPTPTISVGATQEDGEPKKPFSFTNQTAAIFKTPTLESKPKTRQTEVVTQQTSETDFGEVPSLFRSYQNDSNKKDTPKPFWMQKSSASAFDGIIFENTFNDDDDDDDNNKASASIFSNPSGVSVSESNDHTIPIVEPTKSTDYNILNQSLDKKKEIQLPAETPSPNIPTTTTTTTTTTVPINNKENEILQEKERKRIITEELMRKQKEEDERQAKKLQEEIKLNEIRRKQEELKRTQEIERRKQAELLYEIEIKNQVQCVIDDVLLEVEKNLIKNRLQEISQNIKMRKVLQLGRRWKNLTYISRKKRKNFFDNPVWVSSRSVGQEAEELFSSSQNLALHDIKRYKYGTPNYIVIKEKRNFKQLDIYKIVWKILFEQLYSEYLCLNLFWKIGFSIPDDNNDLGLNKLEQMLKSTLELTQTENGLMSVNKIQSNNGGSLSYCIKKLIRNENNSNGLIFFNSASKISQINLQRFNRIVFNHKEPSTWPLPLAILIKTNDNSEIVSNKIEQQLNLNDLLNNQIISKFAIFIYTEHNFENMLSSSLQFLAKHYSDYSNKLEANELATILRNCLADEFWYRIRSSMDLNIRFSILLENPNNVIDLHNDALKFCIKLLFNKNNYNLPNFPTEFKQLLKKETVALPCGYEHFPDYWNSSTYVNKLKKIVKSFHLPKITNDWPPKNQDDFQKILQNYCSNIFEGNTNIVYKIFSIVYRKFQGNFNDCINRISWVDIIELIILEKINSLQLNDQKYTIHTLAYNSEEMKEYRKVPWWFQLKTIQKGIKHIKYIEEFTEPEIITMDATLEEDDQIDLDKTLIDMYNKTENIQHNQVKHEYNELQTLLDDLEKSMEIQQKIMKKFQENALMSLE